LAFYRNFRKNLIGICSNNAILERTTENLRRNYLVSKRKIHPDSYREANRIDFFVTFFVMKKSKDKVDEFLLFFNPISFAPYWQQVVTLEESDREEEDLEVRGKFNGI
jgi:hypothetical protein